MIFKDIRENILQIGEGAESYVDTRKEYYKLSLFKFLMKSISSLFRIAILCFLFFLSLVILSIAAAYGIGNVLNNLFYGFLVVGSFYIVVAVLFSIFSKQVEKPLIRKFSEFYFEEL